MSEKWFKYYLKLNLKTWDKILDKLVYWITHHVNVFPYYTQSIILLWSTVNCLLSVDRQVCHGVMSLARENFTSQDIKVWLHFENMIKTKVIQLNAW